MISEKDLMIISYLRKNSRNTITNIAKQIGIPVTTAYDRLKIQEKNLIKKHVSLIDFSKLGFHSNVHLAISVDKKNRDSLQEFLLKQPFINSLYKVNYGTDFLAEGIFKDAAEAQKFIENLEVQFNITDTKIYSIIEELKKEHFLTDQNHLEMSETFH